MNKDNKKKQNKQTGSRMSIKAKLIVSLLFIVLIFVASSTFNYNQLQKIETNLEELNQKTLISRYATDLAVANKEAYECFAELYVFNNLDAERNFRNAQMKFNSTLNALKSRVDPEQVSQLETIGTIFNNMANLFENSLLPAYHEGNDFTMVYAIESARHIMRDLNITINNLNSQSQSVYAFSSMAIQGVIAETTSYSLKGLGIVIILVSIISVILYSSINKPIKNMIALSNQIANGDLTAEFSQHKGKGEVAKFMAAFKNMQDNLRGLVKKVLEIAEQVDTSSSQLASNAEETSQSASQVAVTVSELAQGSQEQQNLVNEAVDFINKTAESIALVNDKSRQMSEGTEKVITKAQSGKEIMEEMISQMQAISARVNSSASSVTELKEHSKQISSFVAIITAIAEQTNLLALNAAIEAARAGDQGRGFAVVAEEVRKLAEQSNDAAGEIGAIVQKIHQETDSAVSSMQESTQEVTEGSQIANESGKQFNDIFNEVNNLVYYIKEVESIAAKINTDSNHMIESVNNISAITQENSAGLEEVSATTQEQTASVEEVSSAAVQLAELSKKLQEAVNRFKI